MGRPIVIFNVQSTYVKLPEHWNKTLLVKTSLNLRSTIAFLLATPGKTHRIYSCISRCHVLIDPHFFNRISHDHQSVLIERIPFSLSFSPSLSLSFSLTIRLFRPSLLLSPLDGTKCLPRDYECNFFWSSSTSVYMCCSPLENIVYEFVLISAAMSSMSSLSYFAGLWDWR